VIGRDLEVMRGIVERDRLGAVADPADPEDLARALRDVLEQPAAGYGAMRDRCLAVSRDVFNWETAVQPYLELITRLRSARARERL
jgi:glycosyltransferase involved in cell wall biosynthesis